MWWPFTRQPTARGRFLPIAPAKLQVGMYVWLPCRWYQHPFPSNRFRLTHAQQLTIIRRLPLKTVYYDPLRSDGLETVRESPPPVKPTHQPLLPVTTTSSDPHSHLNHAVKTYHQTVQATEQVLQAAVQEDPQHAADQARQLIVQMTQHLANGALSIGMARIMTKGQVSQSAAIHALETTLLAVAVGRELALTSDAIHALGIAAVWHDLGELFDVEPGHMPVARRTPSGQSGPRHPESGRRLIHRIPNVPMAIEEIIYQHHEHLDGSGYPRQLRREAIHPLARVLRVVDAYTDLLNRANLDHQWTPQQALSELYVVRKQQLWPEAVVALVRVLTVYPPGSFVELNDGRVGLVVHIHGHDPLRPHVIVYQHERLPPGPVLVDLASEHQAAIVKTLRLRDVPPALLTHLTQQHVLDYLLQNSTSWDAAQSTIATGGRKNQDDESPLVPWHVPSA